MDEKQTDSGGLLWQESGTVAHFCVNIVVSVHDNERPSRECGSHFKRLEIAWQRSLHNCNSYWASFSPPQCPKFETSSIRWWQKQTKYLENVFFWKKSCVVLSQISGARWICGCFINPDIGAESAGVTSILFGRALADNVWPGAVFLFWGECTEVGGEPEVV